MFKIFISNVPVYLLEEKDDQTEAIGDDKSLKEEYTGKKSLLSLIERIERGIKEKSVRIYHSNSAELFEEFQSLYKLVFAAGGVVRNSSNEVLLIYRKNKWDLPKGKIEKDESKEDAGVREVMEETGIKKLNLTEQLFIYPWKQPCTYHTYWEDGKRILKYTYWFMMTSTDQSVFEPQLEEDITKVEWVSPSDFPKLMKRSYGSITDVLAEIK